MYSFADRPKFLLRPPAPRDLGVNGSIELCGKKERDMYLLIFTATQCSMFPSYYYLLVCDVTEFVWAILQ